MFLSSALYFVPRSFEEKHQNARHTSVILSKNLSGRPIQTYVQSGLRDMQHAWLRHKADEIQSFADRGIRRNSLNHWRQFMVQRAQEPSHFLVQMEMLPWLTKKLSWKDRLNTLMVPLIAHRLSKVNILTVCYRWNIICYLTSLQPYLKQWKQKNACRLVRFLDKMPYRQRSIKRLFHRCRATDKDVWRKEAITNEFKDVSVIHLFK